MHTEAHTSGESDSIRDPAEPQKPARVVRFGKDLDTLRLDGSRRIAVRRECVRTVDLLTFSGVWLSQRARNVSETGLFVETSADVDVGDPIVIAVSAPRRFFLTGRVRWLSPFGRTNGAAPGLGIEIVADASLRLEFSAALRDAI